MLANKVTLGMIRTYKNFVDLKLKTKLIKTIKIEGLLL